MVTSDFRSGWSSDAACVTIVSARVRQCLSSHFPGSRINALSLYNSMFILERFVEHPGQRRTGDP